MRLLRKISIYFIYPVSFMMLGFWLNMRLDESSVREISDRNKMRQDNPEFYAEALYSGNNLIDADTRFVIKSFDLRDSSRTENEKAVPEQYIGMDRQAFLDTMEEYEASPSLEDRSKGFLSLQVEHFSAEEVVIQKNYESAEKNTEFYLAVENNYIVVYESDKKTRYMSTGIPIQNMSEELAKEIMEFKYIGSEAELYHFLESYSS